MGSAITLAKLTFIGWADGTWNPWYGCSKVSEGCKFCYADRDMSRRGLKFNQVQRSKTTFEDPNKWDGNRIIFTCSWSDWFHPDADAWRDDAWEIIRNNSQHFFLILTKRIELARERLPDDWGNGYSNVAIGISASTQARLEERIYELLRLPARFRFLSLEPLLDEIIIGLMGIVPHDIEERYVPVHTKIHWVIAGGESGYKGRFRPMNLDHARMLRDECAEIGTPFFFKQVGGHQYIEGVWGGDELDGCRHRDRPFVYHKVPWSDQGIWTYDPDVQAPEK